MTYFVKVKIVNNNISNINFFKESLDVQVILDIEANKFIMCNGKVYDIYGYTQDEFLSITPYDLSVDFLKKYEMENKQEFIVNRGFDKFITKHKTKSGKILDIYVKSKKLNIENTHLLYITLISLEDEEELKSYYNDKFKLKQKKYIRVHKTYQWDLSSRILLKKGELIDLSNNEKKLLSILINNINSSVSKEFIYKKFDTKITSNSLISIIKRIRKKTSYDFITTIYSNGYKVNS